MSIKLADATFTYMKGTPLAHTALKNINLEIQQGEFVALVGHAVGRAVVKGEAERGIAICGSGIGISIACNKVPGVRAALCTSVEMAEMCRRHNNANVICMGARMISEELAYAMIDTWMTTEFEGGKHERRINELDDINF